MKKIILIAFYLVFVLQLSAQQKTEIKQEELPQVVIQDLRDNYSKYTVSRVIKKNKKQRITFEIEAQKKKTLLILIYDENGVFLEKIKSKEITYENSLNELNNDSGGGNSAPQSPPTPPF